MCALLSPDSPVNLLGRDLLYKLKATIFCALDGVFMELPEKRGMQVNWLLCTLWKKKGMAKSGSFTPCWKSTPKQIEASLRALGINGIVLIRDLEPVKIAYRKDKLWPCISNILCQELN